MIEWCVIHPSYPNEPHRGPMSETEAREWVREAEEDDGFRVGLFYVGYREVGPWTGEPTEQCIQKVLADVRHFNRIDAITYITRAARGNLICLDCGSENHTRGHDLCNYGKAAY